MGDALVREGVVGAHDVPIGLGDPDDPTCRRQFAKIANTAGLCVFAALAFCSILIIHLLRDAEVLILGAGPTLIAAGILCLAAGFCASIVRRRMEEQIATVAASLVNTVDQDLTAALDCLPEGVAIWDSEQRLIAANEKFRNTAPRMAAALQPGVVLEHTLETEIDAGYVPEFAKKRLRERRGDQALGDRRPLLRNIDGRDYRIQEIPTESGGSITISTDVTAQRAREKAISDNEDRFNIALQAANEGLWDLDLRSNEFFISPRALTFIGIEAGNGDDTPVSPRDWFRRIHKDDRRQYFDSWRRHLRGETSTFRAEYRVRDASGKYRWIFDRGLALTDSTGMPFRIGGSMIDISDRKATEQALEESRRQAELAGRSKSELLANMGHEIKTPLHAIIGFSDLLRAGGVSGDDYREYADYIRDAGTQLDQIVTRLMDFARADAGTLELSESTVDLEACIESVHNSLGIQARGKGIELHVDLPANLPPLIADEAKLRQILIQLLNNAIKFTPSGGRVLIEARWTLSKGIRIDIHDTGKGMTKEEVSRCLEPFASAELTLNRGGDGPGLGLTVVKSFVELHQGLFLIESEPGKGTTASVRLPAHRLA
jgi:PAS domain S-box-containing protein